MTPKPKPKRNTSGLKRGGQPGRTKGVPNKATIEAKAVASRLVDDREYQARLLRDLRSGTLPPAVETMLWYYAHGKPKEQVEVTTPESTRVIHEVVIREKTGGQS